MPEDPLTAPVDPAARDAMAAEGLRYDLVDRRDAEQVRDWIAADARGFHDPLPSEGLLDLIRPDFPLQRTIGVWDDTIVDARSPVGTIASWPAALTLPGGEATAWAISSVSVAPTHRRRGVARSMLEAELRTAVAAGLPLAALTVSEATIYSRFGFGPAAWSAALRIDADRAGWLGGPTPGRVQLVDRETAIAAARDLFPTARRATTGDVQVVGHRFDRLFGSAADDADLRRRRFARYDDADGTARGLVVYALTEDADDFTNYTADVLHLVTTTDDAYAALWRFVLELDLVRTVRAGLRSVDEPLRWLVRDQRAIRTTELREHLWVRVLDPAAALEARTYAGAGRVGLRVTDPDGWAEGEWLLTADDGGAGSVAAEAAPEGVPTLELPVDLLGSLLVGGVPAVTLVHAGRIAERSPGDAAAADRLLRSPEAPVLATWF